MEMEESEVGSWIRPGLRGRLLELLIATTIGALASLVAIFVWTRDLQADLTFLRNFMRDAQDAVVLIRGHDCPRGWKRVGDIYYTAEPVDRDPSPLLLACHIDSPRPSDAKQTPQRS
jgi:hypothetical protein